VQERKVRKALTLKVRIGYQVLEVNRSKSHAQCGEDKQSTEETFHASPRLVQYRVWCHPRILDLGILTFWGCGEFDIAIFIYIKHWP
jgi:hypothetical protein